MSNIIPITAGDLFAVYGTVGYIDYSFRRRLKLDAPIDPDILDPRAGGAGLKQLCKSTTMGGAL